MTRSAPLVHVPTRLKIVATLAALPDGDTLSFTRPPSPSSIPTAAGRALRRVYLGLIVAGPGGRAGYRAYAMGDSLAWPHDTKVPL